MATTKYRFIPFSYKQEVAKQLASETPVQMNPSIYLYSLPKLSEEVRQLVFKEVVSKSANLDTTARLQTRKTNDINNWAKAEEKVITDLENPLTKPRFIWLKANIDNFRLWTDDGYTSVLVPLFDGTIQVSLRAQGSDEESRIDWGCEFILHLNEKMGIRPLSEDIVFHLNLLRLAIARGTMVEEEEEVSDAGVSRTSERQ